MQENQEVKRIFVEYQKCNGCRICELRCSFEHYRVYAPTFARIHIHKNEREGIAKPVVCKQCAKPPCVPACPENALTKDEEKGYIKLDKQKCTGCGLCIEACPFGAITLHPESLISLICDTCSGNPQCVEYCPEEALHFMTPSEFRQYKALKKTMLV